LLRDGGIDEAEGGEVRRLPFAVGHLRVKGAAVHHPVLEDNLQEADDQCRATVWPADTRLPCGAVSGGAGFW